MFEKELPLLFLVCASVEALVDVPRVEGRGETPVWPFCEPQGLEVLHPAARGSVPDEVDLLLGIELDVVVLVDHLRTCF